MATKALTVLLLVLVAFSSHGKRKELTPAELAKLYPVQVVGKVISSEKNEFDVLILKDKFNSLKGHIKLDSENPLQKPNENPKVGGVYLFFIKKKNSGNYEIGRSIEVQDYLISDDEMKFRALKTECDHLSVGCILNSR